MQMARRQRVEQWGEYLCTLRNRRRCCLKLPACDPSGAPSTCRSDRRLSPEVLKSIRRKFGVTHRVLDVFVPEPGL